MTDPPKGDRAIAPQGRVIGVDLGSVRIGIAVSDGGQRLATGSSALRRSGDRSADRAAIASLAREYEAVGVVVGMPRSLSGAAGPAARAASAEVESLREVLDVPIEVCDERLSTVSASAALRAGGQRSRRRRELVDQTAAAVILQSWLDSRSRLGA